MQHSIDRFQALQTVDKREVELKYPYMECLGCKQVLDLLMGKTVIAEFVTDANT